MHFQFICRSYKITRKWLAGRRPGAAKGRHTPGAGQREKASGAHRAGGHRAEPMGPIPVVLDVPKVCQVVPRQLRRCPGCEGTWGEGCSELAGTDPFAVLGSWGC